mgnify:CR=1 FL=1
MELIKGSASLFFIVRNGVEIPVGCLTSNPIDESAEMMETTTRDNEGWKTSIPMMQSYSIALDGFMTMDDPNSGRNIISYRELRKIKRNREQIVWKIKTLNGWYVDSGKAYIENISFTDPVDDMIGFSASLVGYGIPNDLNGEYDIYSDEITYNYTYSHEPENDPNSGEWFLANLLFNNYFNAFGILYNCDLKIKLISVPVKGFLAHNTTNQIFAPDDVISYCEKDNLVYYPNGFNNDLGVTGNFAETFSYKIIDQDGRIGRLTTHTLIMTDSVAVPIDLSVSILWDDDTSAPKTGNLPNITVKLGSLIFDPADPVVTQQWEVWNGTEWVFYADKTADSQTIALPYEFNQIRLKVVSQYSVTAYSNVLTYTKTAVANIYITDVVQDSIAGTTSYKLHVENENFSGFVNIFGNKNAFTKNAHIEDNFGGSLFIPANNTGEEVFKSAAVTIPIGTYNCVIYALGAPKSMYQDVEVNGGVSYGHTQNYYDSTVSTTCTLFIPANEL